MLSLISSADSIMFTIIWQSSLFIFAGLMASYLWKRNPARAHHILLLSMIAFVAVPTITIAVKHLDLGIFVTNPLPTVEYKYINTSDDSVTSHEMDLAFFDTSVPIEFKKPGLPWKKILISAWVSASLILVARLILTFILGIRLINKSQLFKSPKITKSIKLAASKLGINKNITISISKSVSCPVIWCWKRKPILLLPADPKFLNDKIDLTGIFCHELAHLKRRDYIAGLLLEVTVAFLPWHPLLWLAKRQLIDLSEHACDDWAIATGGCRIDYAESLIDLVPAQQMAFIPAVTRNKSFLKRRVMRILKESHENPRLSRKWILSTASIASCIILTTAIAQPKSERSGFIDPIPQHDIVLEPINPASSTNQKNAEGKNLNQSDLAPFEKLNLPDGKIRDLEKLLTDYRKKVSEAFQAFSGQSLSEEEVNNKEQIILERQKAEFKKQALDLLGSENYKIYNDYWARSWERNLVTQFIKSLSDNDAISDKKEQEFIDAMYQARKDVETKYGLDFFHITPVSFFVNRNLSEKKKTMIFELFDRYIESAWSALSVSQAEQFENKIYEIEEIQKLTEMY